MNLEEYRLTGRSRYVAFVDAVRVILTAVTDDKGFTPHAITGRAKDPTSLAEKLANRGIDPAAAIDEEVKDLAGCRIVFLTNSQVDAFRNSGAIPENFDVIGVNEHHPVPGTDTKDKLFDSTNYLVTLKTERVSLPEYRHFAGLKMEIQVQTLLNHAWAEMGHDTIYKEPRLRHVDKRHTVEIGERMKRVMREHLLPAGHDLDKIAKDFNRILRADAATDETLATIEGSDNNDDLLEALETVETLVLPFIVDSRDAFIALVPKIAAAVERVRGTQSAPVESIFGPFPGKTGEAVALRAAELLGRGMHLDITLTLRTLVQLYAGAASDGERKIWRDLGARFAAHDANAWTKVGPGVQQAIAQGIRDLGDEDRRVSRGLVLAMAAKMLSCEVGGMSSGTLNTVLVHTGSIGSGESVARMRSETIDILERYLDEDCSDDDRTALVGTLWAAASPPMHGGSEALRAQVMHDAARVADILRERAGGWSLELRRNIEVRAERVHRMFRAIPEPMAGDANLVAARDRVVEAIIGLRDALNADEEYVLYKTLVGRDSVAPTMWQDPKASYLATTAWRAERFPQLAQGVGADQGDEWSARIRGYLKLAENGTDKWPIAEFAEVLAASVAAVGKHLLREIDDELRPVLVRLLLGLEKAGEADFINLQVARLLGERRYLADVADWLGRRPDADPDLLGVSTDRAVELGDVNAVLQSINAAGRIYQRVQDARLIDRAMIPSIAFLTSTGDADWINHALGLVEGSMVAALDEGQSRSLLQSFVAVPNIDYDADRVLAVVGGRFPHLVFEFFGSRLERERDGGGKGFEAIPYDVHDLKSVFARGARELIAATRRWHQNDRRFHQFRGGRLIANVFPDLENDVVVAIGAVVAEGDRDGLAFVLDTLSAYDGDERILPLCMDVVGRLEAGDELLGRVSEVLAERGVMTGEFGRVEADRAMFEHLGAWLGDRRETVRTFVEGERRRLQQSMAWEQRRAAREVEQRKRDWGEPEEANTCVCGGCRRRRCQT